MKKVFEFIGTLLAVIFFLILFIFIVLPLMILETPFSWHHDKKFNEKYEAFLKSQEGKNYFIYNNRKKSLDFIENKVLQRLSPKVEVLYLEGTSLKKEQKDEYYSVMINRIKNYTKFPHLMKVRNGKVEDVSINNEMFNWKSKSKNQKYFFKKLHSFFEIEYVFRN